MGNSQAWFSSIKGAAHSTPTALSQQVPTQLLRTSHTGDRDDGRAREPENLAPGESARQGKACENAAGLVSYLEGIKYLH